MADNSQAPTLEKVALSAAAQPGAGVGAPPDAAPERLMAAIRYGWAIEELVYRLAYWTDPPSTLDDPAALAAYKNFPPDLTHQRSPAEHIRELQAQFVVDGPLLLLDKTRVPPSAIQADANLTALLKAYESGGQVGSVDPSRSTPIAQSVRLWDADIVDLIVDQPPAVLAAYELGKGLSRTLWDIELCQLPSSGLNVADAWSAKLGKDRVGELRQRLTIVSPMLDAATAASVSASLAFWSRAYDLGYLATPAPAVAAGRGADPPKPQITSAADRIPKDDANRQILRAALKEQLTNWYDLLTGRRQLSTFPVTGVVTNLVRQYAGEEFGVLQPLLLATGGILLVAVLIGVLVWAATNGAPPAATGAGTGVAGGLTAILAWFAARGAGLVDRGSQVVADLQVRVGQMQARLSELTASTQAQPTQLTVQSLAGSVLSNVVDQVRLEESKLAISDPLIAYVMGQDKNQGPEQIAKAFLRLILQNDGQSNLERLESVFGALYKEYKPLIPGAP